MLYTDPVNLPSTGAGRRSLLMLVPATNVQQPLCLNGSKEWAYLYWNIPLVRGPY